MNEKLLLALEDATQICGGLGIDNSLKLIAEVRRLKAGDFTEEEFQELCHKFKEDDARRFATGCVEYNRKLFGSNSRLIGTLKDLWNKSLSVELVPVSDKPAEERHTWRVHSNRQCVCGHDIGIHSSVGCEACVCGEFRERDL